MLPFLLITKSKAAMLPVAILFTLITPPPAQQGKLGSVSFPATGSKQAHAHFMTGIAALHSFFYEEALDAFRESTKADPNFMMGYWGEAMAHNHPLWSQQDTEAARTVLKKIGDTSKLTARERAYIDAARILYGEGDKLARDIAFSKAMEKVYTDYPDDLEAAAFYSLSLLGTVRPGDKGYSRQAQAGAIALDVYQKNPNHPGAAHYIIHAFDDPEHADHRFARGSAIRGNSSRSPSRATHAFAHLPSTGNVAGSGCVERIIVGSVGRVGEAQESVTQFT